MRVTVRGRILARCSRWFSMFLLAAAMAVAPIDALAGEPATPLKQGVGPNPTALERITAVSAVSDPLPRITCNSGYSATVFAEGLSAPDGLAFNPSGILYVAEEAGGRVSRIDVYGRVTLVVDGLNNPEGITFDKAGNLYIVEDVSGGRVLKMDRAGVTTTMGAGREAPEGVTSAPDGTLFITESNVQFATNPLDYRTRVTAFYARGDGLNVRTDAWLWSYAGITIGPDGLLYVTNEASGIGTYDSIFTLEPSTGSRTLFASGLVAPEGLRFSADGGFPLYVAEEDTGSGVGRLSLVEADGSHTPFCTGFLDIEDVVLDASGRIYVSEDGSGSVIRIEPGARDRAGAQAVILFIGDGMGEPHRTAARWWAVGRNGVLTMDTAPYGGWARTAAVDDLVTDSAAASTAIATGVKTDNHVIGLDADGNPLTTILERAKAQGMAVGLVTNTEMTHATPAAFAAHVPSRGMMTEIASQMLAAEVDVLLGGGEDEFLPTTVSGCYPQPGARADGRNLIDEAESNGYAYVCDAIGLAAVDPQSTFRLLGLFGDGGMSRPYAPSLAEMTQKAIDVLSRDPDGFFLMVEGGQIDWAAHGNDAARVISDTVDFDHAIAVAQSFAADAGDTLLIVTADHETGGMDVDLTASGAPNQDGPFYTADGNPFYVNWTTQEHTNVNVPTTASGPWSDLLVGMYENTYIHDVMRTAIESSPNISLTQWATPSTGLRVAQGDAITYTLVLTNDGTADATGLVLSDTLPTGVRLVSGSARATPGLEFVSGSLPNLVFIGTLPMDQVVTATFRVTVATTVTGTITNIAWVNSNQTEPMISNPISHPVHPSMWRKLYLPVLVKGSLGSALSLDRR